MDEADERFFVTQKGYEMVWSWMRLQMQEHEMDCRPRDIEMLDDECSMAHAVALTLAVMLPPPSVAAASGMFDHGEDE